MNTKKKICLTVDVEAFARRAKNQPFERLIIGNLENGTGGVIGLMDIAEKHNVFITFFVDFIEYELYGIDLINICKLIVDRGHDLQLHAHPEVFEDVKCKFWLDKKLPYPKSCDDLDELQASHMLDYLIEKHYLVYQKIPVAFRGGSYKLSRGLLNAMSNRNLKIDCSYNASRPPSFCSNLGITSSFYWGNGIHELPIPCLNGFGSITRIFDFNFNAHALGNADRLLIYLEQYFLSNSTNHVATLVMHSWSLSKQLPDSQTQTYDVLQPDLVFKLNDFIERSKELYDFITVEEYANSYL